MHMYTKVHRLKRVTEVFSINLEAVVLYMHNVNFLQVLLHAMELH